jgi:hypothetical protein
MPSKKRLAGDVLRDVLFVIAGMLLLVDGVLLMEVTRSTLPGLLACALGASVVFLTMIGKAG